MTVRQAESHIERATVRTPRRTRRRWPRIVVGSALTATSTVLAACTTGDFPGISPANTASFPAFVEVRGMVANASGSPVGDVTVTSGSVSATTASDGTFDLPDVVAAARVVVTAAPSSASYGPAIAVLFPKSGVYHFYQEITLPTATAIAISGQDGGSATATSQGRPVTITVPPGAFQGSGSLVVAGYDEDNGPGDLTTGDAPGENRLQTQGMIYYELDDENGDPIPLATGMGADIGFAAYTLPEVPESGDLQAWGLQDQARWGQPGPTTTTAKGPNLFARQEGYWNADVRYKTACITGIAQAPSVSCGGAASRATGPDGISALDTTGADGSFCLEGAQTVATTVTIGSTSVSETMPTAPGNCTTAAGACANVGTVMVSDTDCPTGCPNGQVDSPSGCIAPTPQGGTGSSGGGTAGGSSGGSGSASGSGSVSGGGGSSGNGPGGGGGVSGIGGGQIDGFGDLATFTLTPPSVSGVSITCAFRGDAGSSYTYSTQSVGPSVACADSDVLNWPDASWTVTATVTGTNLSATVVH